MSTRRIYGLIGFPLGHSFSQRYFNDKFEREGIDARYLNFEIKDIESLPSFLTQTNGLHGFNVTIPHKQAIIPYLSYLEGDAAKIGAVNVVKVLIDGTLIGYNSDVYGFIESLKPLLAKGRHSHALVLGVGGAARAVCFGLEKLGLKVDRVSRRKEAGEMTYKEVSSDTIRRHTVIVNTTPLGMHPNQETCPDIPYEAVTADHVCFDLVYNPLDTLFMKRCAAQGATVSNGLKMLHLQADRAWQIWNS